MIRLFSHHAKFLLLLLIMWKQLDTNRSGAAQRTLIEQVGLWVNANPTNPLAIWVSDFDWDTAIERADIDEQVDVLIAGLDDNVFTNSKGDVSIISTIIEILGLPWTTNRLAGETLTALRRAILRPAEIASFLKLAKESFQCGRCGHKFVGDEAAVVQRGPDHELVVFCIRCLHPSHGACSICGESAPINSIGIAALTTTKFVACSCKGIKPQKKEMTVRNGTSVRPTRFITRGIAGVGAPTLPGPEPSFRGLGGGMAQTAAEWIAQAPLPAQGSMGNIGFSLDDENFS